MEHIFPKPNFIVSSIKRKEYLRFIFIVLIFGFVIKNHYEFYSIAIIVYVHNVLNFYFFFIFLFIYNSYVFVFRIKI